MLLRIENPVFLCYLIDTRGDTNVQVKLPGSKQKAEYTQLADAISDKVIECRKSDHNSEIVSYIR